MNTFTARRVASVVLLILLAGCSQDTARPKLSGKVTYNGQPLANKTLILTLEGAEGVSQFLPLGAEGEFSGEVPQTGTYKVSIVESMAVMEGVDKKPKDGPKIAAKYRTAASSDYTVAIERGTNDKTIDLKD